MIDSVPAISLGPSFRALKLHGYSGLPFRTHAVVQEKGHGQYFEGQDQMQGLPQVAQHGRSQGNEVDAPRDRRRPPSGYPPAHGCAPSLACRSNALRQGVSLALSLVEVLLLQCTVQRKARLQVGGCVAWRRGPPRCSAATSTRRWVPAGRVL